MNRFAVLLGLIVLVVQLVRSFAEDTTPRRPMPPAAPPAAEAVQPPPAPAPQGRPAPPPSRFDPVMVVEERPRTGDSVGTAFAVAPGQWLTARHVVDGCRRVLLRVGDQWRAARVLGTHSSADIAALATTAFNVAPVPAGSPTLFEGQDGYHLGFPQFRPGDVHSRLIGRARVVHSKREGRVELAYSWAEVRRAPDFSGSLGGISGGPTVDRTGRLIGVNVAESERRGRVTTSAPENIQDVLNAISAQPAGPSVAVTPGDFGAVAGRLRGQFTIVRVFCGASDRSSPPRL